MTDPSGGPGGRQTTEDELRAATLGPLVRLDGTIELVDYDPAWPAAFELEAATIRAALGERVLLLEHAGSTSVSGLPAKPRIDIVLAVADSADESSYAPDLESAGYVLRIREPEWHEHRTFIRPDRAVNVHVFTAGSPEVERMLLFRDHLRADPADRDLYARTKRELASRTWAYVQHYADAKSAVVEAIIERARRAKRARPG
ncbi:MAG TPA: GrpB family protein [Candidatus Limnocylindrales bacterium]